MRGNKALALYPREFDVLFGNLAISYFMLGDNVTATTSEQGDEQRARTAVTDVRRRFPDLKPPAPSARECVAEAWCQFLQTKYLPAWRKAGLP